MVMVLWKFVPGKEKTMTMTKISSRKPSGTYGHGPLINLLQRTSLKACGHHGATTGSAGAASMLSGTRAGATCSCCTLLGVTALLSSKRETERTATWRRPEPRNLLDRAEISLVNLFLTNLVRISLGFPLFSQRSQCFYMPSDEVGEKMLRSLGKSQEKDRNPH